MENNEHFYRAEYSRMQNETTSLRRTISEKEKVIEEQRRLLEECWERIYYKKSWLTLCDDNIDGMKKHIDEMKKDGRYEKLMLEE